MAQELASNVLQLADLVKTQVPSRWINSNTNQARVEQLARVNFEASQRQTRQIAAINELVQMLTTPLQFEEVLSCLLKQVEGVFNVERSCLFMQDPFTKDLAFQIAGGNKADELQPSSFEQNLAGQVTQTGQPIQMTRIDQETPNAVGIPLLAHSQVIGVLVVINKRDGEFSRSEVELLSLMAAYAALAIENARLLESVLSKRDRVIEAEEQARRQLAQDLHDGPTQLISAVAMRLDFCLMLLNKDPTKLPEEIMATKTLAEKAIHEIRTLLFELRPLALEVRGLATALQIFLERRQKDVIETTKLSLKIVTTNPDETIGRQDNKIEAALFAIVQEAVNNAAKHAKAENITVHLKETHSALYVSIIDDGKGFDLDQVMNNYEQRTSLGMVNMRERVQLIGGELTVQSTPGQGTQITVHIPKAKEERLAKRVTTGRLSWP